MAEKPRVKAPKRRDSARSDESSDKRRLLVVGGTVACALAGAAVAFFLIGAAKSPSADDVRSDLEAAGCTFQAVKAQPGRHTLQPDGTAKWNTDPPTSGPHFGFNASGTAGTVIFGSYTEPVQSARLVHNLEHGGVFILYGDDVSAETIAELQGFYDDHRNGTVLAPYPKLGDKIALGAWVRDGDEETAYLAKCASFDRGSFATFLAGFQFRGPEAYTSGMLLPGGN
jgi:hypothetical protein